MERPFLHAAGLDFDHPGNGERVSFSSELADDLKSMLSGLQPLVDDSPAG
jgi:hypothetical protein